jgi:hypothetical protein
MANKVDLNKLRGEIDNRKKEKNGVTSNGVSLPPKDMFLNGLLESLSTGRMTDSTNKIMSYEKQAGAVVAYKRGDLAESELNTVKQKVGVGYVPTKPVIQKNNVRSGGEVEMSEERDELLFQNFGKASKQTLAESIGNFTNPQNTIQADPVQQYQTGYAPTTQINEAYLAESVKKTVNKYLTENLGPVLEDAINSTIIEMYAVERIKEVLHNNKDLIKTLVYETIREIQAKNKKV